MQIYLGPSDLKIGDALVSQYTLDYSVIVILAIVKNQIYYKYSHIPKVKKTYGFQGWKKLTPLEQAML